MTLSDITAEQIDMIDTYMCLVRAIARLSLHTEDQLEEIMARIIAQSHGDDERTLAHALLTYTRSIT
jgi:hypothetical protein